MNKKQDVLANWKIKQKAWSNWLNWFCKFMYNNNFLYLHCGKGGILSTIAETECCMAWLMLSTKRGPTKEQNLSHYHPISPSPLNLGGSALIILPPPLVFKSWFSLHGTACIRTGRGRAEGYPKPTIKIHWPPFTTSQCIWNEGLVGGAAEFCRGVMYYIWSGMANNLWSMMQILKGLEKYEHPGHGGTSEGGKGQVRLRISTIDCTIKMQFFQTQIQNIPIHTRKKMLLAVCLKRLDSIVNFAESVKCFQVSRNIVQIKGLPSESGVEEHSFLNIS